MNNFPSRSTIISASSHPSIYRLTRRFEATGACSTGGSYLPRYLRRTPFGNATAPSFGAHRSCVGIPMREREKKNALLRDRCRPRWGSGQQTQDTCVRTI
ncbi:hypothetical protein VTN02DRAFT_1034 [Thermoascus thermophilus]